MKKNDNERGGSPIFITILLREGPDSYTFSNKTIMYLNMLNIF